MARALEEFYRQCGRQFPWRLETDPYRMALAEVLLTKTRAETVVAPFVDLVERYPTPAALMEAGVADLEIMLRPLGLSNKRAVHLKRMGATLTHVGTEPLRSYETALRVPGLGTYGAAALACFLSGEPIGIVDANVYRVLSRAFGLRPSSIDRLFALANGMAREATDVRAVSYGILDLAAMVCRRKPSCSICPLARECRAAGS